jgi:hypothetical protein
MVGVKRTITGLTSARTMTLGDLRQFLASLDGLPDDASVKARVTFRKHLRSVTVEEDDLGFRDYIRAVGPDPAGQSAKPSETAKAKPAKQTSSA